MIAFTVSSVSNGANDTPPPQRPTVRKVIHATCTMHGGGRGFANLVVTKRDGTIELDPHVTGQCVLLLAEDEAIALRDTLTEWFRVSAALREEDDPQDEHDDEQQRGWYVGRCGHPVPVIGTACFIGPCPDCEPSSP